MRRPTKNAFTEDFQDLVTRYAWGGIWTRPGLDRRTRSVITLTALVARGHWDELAMHVRAARRNGLSEEEIDEVLLQSAVYCGVPAANHAFAVAQGVVDEPRRRQVTGSDVFVYDAVRTPFGRYGGALAGVRPDDLAAHVVRALVERAPGLDPARIDEVVLGNANGAGEDNRNVARMAGLLAGLPDVRARRPPSTGCAAPASTRPSSARGRSPSARPTSSWSAAWSR